ncbi:hypothetical protein [Brevundimonas sp. CEF1]|uniref:hypothetical protein n=1 Tax=Brevundimonas sp. CEF1 TaxID=3442642 RepID=UPI003F515C6E
MEAEVKQALASFDEKDAAFREQVERARAFRDRLSAAGLDVRPQGFSVPLMQRLETAGSPILASIRA